MSGEFGNCFNGYFQEHVHEAVSSYREGRDPLTRLWGEFLEEFDSVAHAISRSEACDAGPDYPILESIAHMKAMQEKLDKIKTFLRPFEDCMQHAVRKHLEQGVKV